VAEKKKRILNIVPVVVGEPLTKLIKETLDKYVSPGFEADYRNPKYGGVDSIEGLYYMDVTKTYIVDEIIQAEKEGYDAVTSLCFSDLGVSEARELVRIPVVSAGEAALYVAMMCGDRLGIVTVGRTYRTRQHGTTMRLVRQAVRTWGVSDRIVYLGTTGFTIEDCEDPKQMEKVLQALQRESEKAMEEKGAEVIVVGCTGMTGLAVELQKRLDVPVVDPSVSALKFAELLVTMNLTHSRLTIPSPDLIGVKCEMKWPPTLREYPR